MDLEEIMKEKTFVIVGDTLNEQKYACIIKNKMISNGYNVYAVGKELKSLNDVPEEIDIIDLCINSKDGLRLIKECNKTFKSIVIQPGASDEELLKYLKEKKYPYIDGCLLVGLSLYKK
ncbi:MAG: CoA-binding protein [Fusobacterium perfoetens]|uniref:CoA-binding protein n=1 Tax=Fusobacterium perfoetens TaxID=852 RepID=UPI0023F0D90E|nr:CoA-binding protein [Fusobacterium perfoetens]MCI6153060.1 CoA-binding protein [Fusobacterium perfoetens]MDY3237457.1 CoA-binding protein [Fusobacterium perfoetens]